MKHTRIIIAFLLFSLSAVSQFDRKQFLSKYSSAPFKEKIKLLATTDYIYLKELEGLLSDSILHLKKQIYTNSESKEPRLLFDIIDINREGYYQNFYKVIFIGENSLQNHTQSFNDSLAIVGRILPSYVKIKNLNKAFELNEFLEKNRYRIPKDSFDKIATKKSILYSLLGLPIEAIKYRKQEFKTSTGDKVNIVASYYNDVGVYFNKSNLPDSAILYFDKAAATIREQLKKTPDDVFYNFFEALTQGNKALSLSMKKQYAEAIPLLKKDVYFSLKSKNNESAANGYLLIVECFLNMNQKEKARIYLDSADKLIQNIDEVTPKIQLNKVKASYYNAIGDIKNAYASLKAYTSLKDSTSTIEKEKQLLNQQVSFDLYNKEQQLLDKEKIIENSKLTEAKQKTFRAYLISGVVMLIAIIVFLFINNNNVKKRESELQIKNEHIWLQNQQIENTLKEKELLIQEIHHRVKNNLQIISSMLSLQSDKINDERISHLLKDARQRIASMALTHQMLYQKQTLSSVSMKEYVETLVKQIAGSYETPHIQLTQKIECENKRLDLDTAIPLGLLINELLTNAYKHAFVGRTNGEISVQLKQLHKDCFLIVKDNGVGLPPEAEKNNSSLGMELIHILAEQLDASCFIARENGTSFTIRLKDLKKNSTLPD